MKWCTKCNKQKSLSDFYVSKSSSTGFTARCKSCTIEDKRQYQRKTREKVNAKNKKWREANKDIHNRAVNNYIKKRLASDPEFKIRRRLANHLWYAVKGQKSSSITLYLGCSLKKLKAHLESKFTDGMTWNNYGDWHIDHIIPVSKFDLTDESNIKKAYHFSNLQPLWAYDNLKKGASYAES